MFSWALEKDRDALIWRLAGIHDGMAPLKELEARRPNPPCLCFLSALWIPVAKSGGKIKEDMKDGATWGRDLRRVGRLAPSSDLLLRDTGDSLHSSRGKARSQAVSLSLWRWSNRSASRCGRWLHSCLLHASGHTGKPRTLEKVSMGLAKPVERTQNLMPFLEWGFFWPGKMKWSIHCSREKLVGTRSTWKETTNLSSKAVSVCLLSILCSHDSTQLAALEVVRAQLFLMMKSTGSHGSFNSHLYHYFSGWEIFTSNYNSSLSCEVPVLVMWLFFNFETSSFSCWSGILGSSKSYHYLLQVCGYTSLSLYETPCLQNSLRIIRTSNIS